MIHGMVQGEPLPKHNRIFKEITETVISKTCMPESSTERDAAFLLTVGSFLLTVELLYLQLTILACLLTVGAFSLTALAFLLTVGAFLLTVGECI